MAKKAHTLKRFAKTKRFVGHEPFSKSASDDDVSLLRCYSEERRDVVEVSIEKLSSTSSSDTERDSLNNVSGGCVTSSKE